MENERKDLMCPIHHPQDVNERTISDMRPTLIDFIEIKLIFFHLIYSRSRFKLSL